MKPPKPEQQQQRGTKRRRQCKNHHNRTLAVVALFFYFVLNVFLVPFLAPRQKQRYRTTLESLRFVEGLAVFRPPIINVSVSPKSSKRKYQILLLSATKEGGEEEPPDVLPTALFLPKSTGETKELQWDLARPPVPFQSETALLNSGVLWRRGEFKQIHGQRLKEVEHKCQEFNMTLDQALLIRKQLAVTKAMSNNWKLAERLHYLERKFGSQQVTLWELSKDLNLPPVNILRAIVKERVHAAYPKRAELPKPHRNTKQVVQAIIRNETSELAHRFLSAWEMGQLQEAKQFDVIGYSEDATEIESSKWERAIYTWMDDRNVNYVSEDDLRAAAGDRRISSTPDCVFLDHCVINGRPVRWMDAKNYYGSALRENRVFVKKLKRQIDKYEAEFDGTGAVVFKHGFCQKLSEQFPSTLFLDAGPLHWDN